MAGGSLAVLELETCSFSMPEYPVFGDVLWGKRTRNLEKAWYLENSAGFRHQLPPAARACPIALLCLPKSSSERACFVVSLLLAARQVAWLSTVVLRSDLRCMNPGSAGLPLAHLFSLTFQLLRSLGDMRTGKKGRASPLPPFFYR